MGRVKEELLPGDYEPLEFDDSDFDDSDYDGEGQVDDSIWDRYDPSDLAIEEYLQKA